MARPCSTCNHPDRAAVEIALANGVACRVLGLKYGLDPSQLSRHKTNHMGDELVARLRVRGARSDEELARIRDLESKSLLDNLIWQRARMYENADRCRKIGDDAGERAAMGEAAKIVALEGKLLGDLGAHITVNHNNTVNLVALPQWHALRTSLARALRPFPDAYTAAIGALQQAEAVELPVIEHAA